MPGRVSALDVAGCVGLSVTAVIEAIPQAPWLEAKIMMAPSDIQAAIGFLPLILLTLTGCLYLWRFLRSGRAARPVVDILTPLNGDLVPWMRTVSGSVFPVGRPVQLLVLSGDKLWHPQPPPTMDGKLWTGECYFGDEAAPSHAGFELVAISADTPVVGPVSELPRRGARSDVVRVIRRPLKMTRRDGG